MSAVGGVDRQSHVSQSSKHYFCTKYEDDLGDEDELWGLTEKNHRASQEAREVSNASSPSLRSRSIHTKTEL